MPTFSQQVNTVNNDGYFAGGWQANGSWYIVGWNTFTPGENYSAFRFINVTIPKNSVINSAIIRLRAIQTDTNALNVKIVGIAEDNTADLSTDPIGRAETSNSSPKNFPSGITNNTDYDFDVKSIVQELVNRGGWGSGAAMGFKLRNNSGSQPVSTWLHFKSRTSTTPTQAAILIVDYTEPASSHFLTKSLTYNIGSKPLASKMLRYAIKDMELNPVPFRGVKVAKPGHNAVNTNKPESFNFHSDYGTLKYFLEGHVPITVNENGKGNQYNQFAFINHNLNYFPFAIVYGKTNLMSDYQPLGRFQAGSGAYQQLYYYITNNRLYMGVKGFYTTTPSVYTADFYYKIFRNNLGF